MCWNKQYAYQINKKHFGMRFQSVVLNGKTYSQEPVLIGVAQSFVLRPSFFPIYINNLSKNLSSLNTKPLADNPLLIIHLKCFSVLVIIIMVPKQKYLLTCFYQVIVLAVQVHNKGVIFLILCSSNIRYILCYKH